MQVLTPQELATWRMLETLAGGKSLLGVIPRITPSFQIPHHLRPLADAFARAKAGPVRVCVSVPPRHSKTETILHAGAWWLMDRPHDTIGYVSYAADIAQSKSRRMRDMAGRVGVTLRDDAKAVNEWRTKQGGGVLATGVGGPLTGHGVNLLIVDDPLKNREEAESITIREKLYDWFTSTAMTRVQPGGSVIVCHTRWHDDDLIGRLTANDDRGVWEYINLPAFSGPEENPVPLWPGMWTLEEMQKRRREVGEYDWASLFQGQPRPRGGRRFQDPARYTHPGLSDPATGTWRILIGVDPAATAKTNADFSCAVVLAVQGKPGTVDFRADVLEVWRGQVEIPELVRRLEALSIKWGAPLAVEAVAGFKAVPQMLRVMNKNLRVYDVHPLGDKFTRALGVSAAWNDGRVRVPVDKAWVPDFLAETEKFTGVGDKHDDQVDALANAYNCLAQFYPLAGLGKVVKSGLPFG